MLDDELPDEVTNLRPRKLRLSQDAERLLEGVTDMEADPKRQEGTSRLRPNAESVNATCCASCGQIEYITREYCRCGHYLAGQIEDEYLAWERDLVETYDHFAAEADRKMKPVRYVCLIAMPFFIWPLLQALLNAEQMSLTTWLWIMPGIAIFGGCALVERFVTAKRDASVLKIQTASFERFLTERLPMGRGASSQMGAK